MQNHEEIRQNIDEILRTAFNPETLSVIDESSQHARHKEAMLRPSAGHFYVSMKSASFDGKNAVARHRMVYQRLSSLMDSHIHALRMDLKSSDE